MFLLLRRWCPCHQHIWEAELQLQEHESNRCWNNSTFDHKAFYSLLILMFSASLQKILSSGTFLWMGSRIWTVLQANLLPKGSGPALLGATRCKHAVRLLREPPADRRPRWTTERITRTTIRADTVRLQSLDEPPAEFNLNFSVFSKPSGEVYSPHRQGLQLKKRRLDSWVLHLCSL